MSVVPFPAPSPTGVEMSPRWDASSEGELVGVYLSEPNKDGSPGPRVFVSAGDLGELCKLDAAPRGLASPAARVRRSHDLVERAARELAGGYPGSGVKALVFAASTHLALTIGTVEARAFFEMIARLAGDTTPVEPEPSA